MKVATRFSFPLLISLLCVITLASAQVATITPAATARHNDTGSPLQRFRETSISLSDLGNLSGSSVNEAMPNPWTLHLVAELVKRPELNGRQVQIILDAISLSSSELFAASENTRAINATADHARQDLRRRALTAFPKNEVANLFDNLNGGQSDKEVLEKYYDFSAVPLRGRKILFRRSPASNKSGLWRTHFALYLIKHPELNEWQKEIILAAMSLTTPEYFEARSRRPDWEAKVRELESKIVVAFPLEEAANIFATLGSNAQAAKRGLDSPSPGWLKSVKYTPLGDSGTYRRSTHTGFSQAVPENNCSCSTASDYCSVWSYCKAGGCSQTENGCGTFWSYPCNGVCQ